MGLVGSLEWLCTKAIRQIPLRELNTGERVAEPQREDGYSNGFT